MPKPPARPPKSVVAFKVDPDLAAVLDAMPNKSEFIRAAVEARLSGACPLCHGTGVAPRGANDDLARMVARHPFVACSVCGQKAPRPCHAAGDCHAHPRDEAFERWGDFYCDGCFAETLACKSCSRPFTPENARQRRCEHCRHSAARA